MCLHYQGPLEVLHELYPAGCLRMAPGCIVETLLGNIEKFFQDPQCNQERET